MLFKKRVENSQHTSQRFEPWGVMAGCVWLVYLHIFPVSPAGEILEAVIHDAVLQVSGRHDA